MKRIHESLHGLVEEKAVSIADILRQEGMQQGELKKALEIAQNMLGEGIPTATIAKVTHLPRKKLTDLRGKKNS